LKQARTVQVTTALLGTAKIPGLTCVNADGSPLIVDTDYFGAKRSPTKPTAGSFEKPGQGTLKLKVR
jgi:alpha-L-arabinofuranosidase